MNPATSNDRPERRRLFEIGALTFDIDQAHRIVRERPRQVGRLDVTAAAVNAGFHTAGLPRAQPQLHEPRSMPSMR